MSEESDFLDRAVETALKNIDASRGAPGTCASHGPIVDGVYTLLLCKQSELKQRRRLPGAVWAVIVGVAGVVSAAVSVVALCVGR
jgi:hypothetical protein